MAQTNASEGGRVLLIPFAPGIGDMVMMEPLLRAAVAGLPGSRLSMVACDYASDLLPPGPYQLVSSNYFWSEPPAPLRSLHRLIPQRLVAWAAEPAISLDLGRFDRIINLFWEWESRLPFERWWTPMLHPEEKPIHTIDLLADFLEEELERPIPREERIPRIALPSDGVAWAEGYLAEEGIAGLPIAALVVSAANALKWWDAVRWAELNQRLLEAGWATIIIAPRQSEHAQQVFSLCEEKPLWPALDIRQMAGMLARSTAVISIDTGPLHMAASLGTPWVGLFGSTNPEVVGPYDSALGRALLANFQRPASCRDCYLAFKNREDRCLSLPTTGCTTLIPVDSVLEAVEAVTGGRRTVPAGAMAVGAASTGPADGLQDQAA